jgi:lysozyme
MKWLLPASALTIAAGVYLARKNAAAWGLDAMAPELQDVAPDQLPSAFESIVIDLTPTTYQAANVTESQALQNQSAFLDMIAFAEGTNGPNGYRTLFGGGLFDSFDDHPRQFKSFTNRRGETLKTSAAGRYQFLSRTWDALAKRLALPDFGPQSQDAAALELIRERGALNDVRAGRTEQAIAKCAPVWASLPGAGYAQPERQLSVLVAQYRAAGGSTEA